MVHTSVTDRPGSYPVGLRQISRFVSWLTASILTLHCLFRHGQLVHTSNIYYTTKLIWKCKKLRKWGNLGVVIKPHVPYSAALPSNRARKFSVHYANIFLHADSRNTYSDYQYIDTYVSFSSGLGVGDEVCVSVSIFDDTRVEDDEYFTMFFANRDGVAVSTNANSVRITISDDDGNQN